MQIYKVGGAVRDLLLGIPQKDVDWVITGTTPEALLELGYQAVGADFPVFLHPETKEEYALARTERKKGQGYKGFECFFSPDVRLEDDLNRRDLTINAMAMTPEGKLIDPFNGQADLNNKILRHVSDAFVEDPLRVLRVARFLARFHHYGFRIADETLALMQDISASGELESLTPERVWRETQKALSENSPVAYFSALQSANALEALFPEIHALFGVPQDPKHHPEIDTGIHTFMVLEQATRLSNAPEVRFAALTHDLGKALTPEALWPKHPEHDEKGLVPLNTLCERFKVPNKFRAVANKTCRWHTACHQALESNADRVLLTLEALDVFRTPTNLEPFLLACEADSRGRPGFEEAPYPQARFMRAAHKVAEKIQAKPFVDKSIRGKEIGSAIQVARRDAIHQLRLTWEQ